MTGTALGLPLLVMLALLYLGYVDSALRSTMVQEAAAQERHAAYLEPGVSVQALVQEPAVWLNTMISSGWEASLRAYASECATEVIESSLEELQLPKTLRSIRLQERAGYLHTCFAAPLALYPFSY